MKKIILALTLFFSSLLNLLKSEGLPEGSTIYYSTNNKCVIYGREQKICSENWELYNNYQGNKIIISEITNYSESNYYELNLCRTDDVHRNCIITYFSDKNELTFKYYNININNNVYAQKEYTYFNTSLNPLNKGINCQTKDWDYRFICFYFNKDKDVVKMDIKPIENTFNVTIDFQVGKINKQEHLFERNIIIMSSLFKNKYKFYSHSKDDKFSVHFNMKVEFNFLENSNNEFDEEEFNSGANGKFCVFATFKKNNGGQLTHQRLNLQGNNVIFISENGSTNTIQNYNGDFDLYFEEVINIFILRFSTDIPNYIYEYSFPYNNEDTDI